MTDANGKNYRQFKHNLRSRKFADVQVLTLSRRKQGFESPRERQGLQALRPLPKLVMVEKPTMHLPSRKVKLATR